jgi:hypothetical protein
LSGVWTLGVNLAYAVNISGDLTPSDVNPDAASLAARRFEDAGKDDPETLGCLPGGPRHIIRPGRVKVIQSPLVIVMLFEDLTYRQIFLDGRSLPTDPNPSWMGYSVGHWDDDTLIVESNGFNARSWLDLSGHPHTENLRIVERYQRRDFGHLTREVTLIDPTLYAKPMTVSAGGVLQPDSDLLEYVCAENPIDRAHVVGLTTSERRVDISPETLASYAGVYVVGRQRFVVRVADHRLTVEDRSGGQLPLVPLSQTTFAMFDTYEFRRDAAGRVTELRIYAAEGVVTATREP